MSYISKIDLSTAPQEVRAAVDNHLAQGYQLTNEKLTLLHNVTAFHTLEESSYELDRELQRLIGKRAADFYEYAISLQNDCLVCSAYFSRLLEKNHIDFATFDFTDDERLLIEYGRAIARDPKHCLLYTSRSPWHPDDNGSGDVRLPRVVRLAAG